VNDQINEPDDVQLASLRALIRLSKERMEANEPPAEEDYDLTHTRLMTNEEYATVREYVQRIGVNFTLVNALKVDLDHHQKHLMSFMANLFQIPDEDQKEAAAHFTKIMQSITYITDFMNYCFYNVGATSAPLYAYLRAMEADGVHRDQTNEVMNMVESEIMVLGNNAIDEGVRRSDDDYEGADKLNRPTQAVYFAMLGVCLDWKLFIEDMPGIMSTEQLVETLISGVYLKSAKWNADASAEEKRLRLNEIVQEVVSESGDPDVAMATAETVSTLMDLDLEDKSIEEVADLFRDNGAVVTMLSESQMSVQVGPTVNLVLDIEMFSKEA
jgi:hypothetical protein